MIIEETDVEGMRVESYYNACLLQISRLVGGICDCPICQMISFPNHPIGSLMMRLSLRSVLQKTAFEYSYARIS